MTSPNFNFVELKNISETCAMSSLWAHLASLGRRQMTVHDVKRCGDSPFPILRSDHFTGYNCFLKRGALTEVERTKMHGKKMADIKTHEFVSKHCRIVAWFLIVISRG